MQAQCMLSHGVCVSVTFVHSVKTNKRIFKLFSPSASHTILVFRTKWHGNIPMENPQQGRRMQVR